MLAFFSLSFLHLRLFVVFLFYLIDFFILFYFTFREETVDVFSPAIPALSSTLSFFLRPVVASAGSVIDGRSAALISGSLKLHWSSNNNNNIAEKKKQEREKKVPHYISCGLRLRTRLLLLDLYSRTSVTPEISSSTTVNEIRLETNSKKRTARLRLPHTQHSLEKRGDGKKENK